MRLLSFLCYTYFRKILCQSLMFHFFCLRLSSEAIPKMRNGSRTKFCENEQTKILVSTLLPFTKSFRIPVSFAWLTRWQQSGVVWGEDNYMKNVGHMCDVWKFPTILINKNCNIIPFVLGHSNVLFRRQSTSWDCFTSDKQDRKNIRQKILIYDKKRIFAYYQNLTKNMQKSCYHTNLNSFLV
jgi:hypothetical protein